MDDDLRIVKVPAAVTRELRHIVLRPHQRPDELVYPGDDAPDSVHFAALEKRGSGELLLCVASLYREDGEGLGEGGWRLRGMATLAEHQGRGIGGRVLASCQQHASQAGGRYLWCNARTSARRFYERAGLMTVGDEFMLIGIPHYVMVGPLGKA